MYSETVYSWFSAYGTSWRRFWINVCQVIRFYVPQLSFKFLTMTNMQTDVPLLEYVQDDLGDDFHKSLDKMLFAAFTSVDYPTEVTAREVIAQLVRDLPARLDQKYSNEVSERFALFRAYPQLEGLVSEAWASGSFRKIRSLSMFNFSILLQVQLHILLFSIRNPSKSTQIDPCKCGSKYAPPILIHASLCLLTHF